ncbi:2 beta-glucanase [Sistotremastrum niveocremeum HHB9708]|uniref:2 beta-glucanase n=1 Tax=Sistotremastrum niveocremeum HHB9708 TaxID=1314777 RepID=A0A164RSN7_9AGAM|nr:2 beta-glucanase [Sistotremastrum niveocremeum HHB9708]
MFYSFAALSFASLVAANTYSLESNIVGQQFLSSFSFNTFADPTHGRVNYVDQPTAQAQNLTFASGNTFIMRADFTSTLNPSGPGRNSVRIQSNAQVENGVIAWDIRHMPEGCGTWPSAWTVAQVWPGEGEIDVIEGANNVGPNQSTLHTAPGCTMPSGLAMSGHPLGTNCDAVATGNVGCGTSLTPTSTAFNANGGGVYAMERTPDFIKMWFWARNDPSIPSDLASGANAVNTAAWPAPYALFPSTNCNINQFFGPHNIIFDLTLCGDWAGSTYPSSGCPGTCVDFVNNNPAGFVNAFWDIASLRIFQ